MTSSGAAPPRGFPELETCYSIWPAVRLPFSHEARILYSFVLTLQAGAPGRGDLLEIGVEHGGTGLLSLVYTREGEQHYFVDIRRSQHFESSLRQLPASLQDRVVFLECSSQDARTQELAAKMYRWIHIDAAHDYRSVSADISRYAPCLASGGVLVMDDFFQPLWPGATEAILDYLGQHRDRYRPLLLGFNKLYLTTNDKAGSDLLAAAKSVIEEWLSLLGTFSVRERDLLGKPILAAVGRAAPNFRELLSRRGDARPLTELADAAGVTGNRGEAHVRFGDPLRLVPGGGGQTEIVIPLKEPTVIASFHAALSLYRKSACRVRFTLELYSKNTRVRSQDSVVAPGARAPFALFSDDRRPITRIRMISKPDRGGSSTSYAWFSVEGATVGMQA